GLRGPAARKGAGLQAAALRRRAPVPNLAGVASAERFWTRRLRWRLLGAWRWPAFAVFTVVDAVLLHTLGTGVRFNIPVSLILASFGNIALLAALDLVARFAARKRVERGLPADDPHLQVAIDRGAIA